MPEVEVIEVKGGKVKILKDRREMLTALFIPEKGRARFIARQRKGESPEEFKKRALEKVKEIVGE